MLRFLLMFAAAAVSFSALGSGEVDGESNSDIPLPPEQSVPWTPPSAKLAPVVTSAITELFNDGLADPRGCEYREIEIPESKNWTIKTLSINPH
jgi:hypothetical protein